MEESLSCPDGGSGSLAGRIQAPQVEMHESKAQTCARLKTIRAFSVCRLIKVCQHPACVIEIPSYLLETSPCYPGLSVCLKTSHHQSHRPAQQERFCLLSARSIHLHSSHRSHLMIVNKISSMRAYSSRLCGRKHTNNYQDVARLRVSSRIA